MKHLLLLIFIQLNSFSQDSTKVQNLDQVIVTANFQATEIRKVARNITVISAKDIENVPMKEPMDVYFKREVLPFAPDAWYDKNKVKIGYEIPFNKYFYQYEGLRPLKAIAADILELEQKTDGLLKQIIGL